MAGRKIDRVILSVREYKALYEDLIEIQQCGNTDDCPLRCNCGTPVAPKLPLEVKTAFGDVTVVPAVDIKAEFVETLEVRRP